MRNMRIAAYLSVIAATAALAGCIVPPPHDHGRGGPDRHDMRGEGGRGGPQGGPPPRRGDDGRWGPPDNRRAPPPRY